MIQLEGVDVPANEGDLPLIITRDGGGKIVRIRIDFSHASIRQQFPWTQTMKDVELG